MSNAQPPKLSFKHISSEQGLSNSTIEVIFQDSRGFIWFGTRDGLNRYDGNQNTVYRYQNGDTNSISDNYIKTITEDKEGSIWIGTLNGLNRYDKKKNSFTRFSHRPGGLAHNHITSLLTDKQGQLWIATYGGGITIYQPKNKSFYPLPANRALPNQRVNCLFEDSGGLIWVGTETSLTRFDPASSVFTTFYNVPGALVIREDKKGNLWIGSLNNGLYVWNRSTDKFDAYQHNEQDPASLGSNQVRSIEIDKKGNIWVGGINGGLDLFHLPTRSFYHYQNEPGNPFSLSQRTVSALCEDLQGNLWVGTHRGGVNLYMPNKERFKLYRQEQSENSLSYNDVKAFCEDGNGNIWIGTDGGGLNFFNRKNNNFQHYRYNPFQKNSLGSNEVLHVMEDSQGNIWVGTWGGGLNLFNKATGTFTRFVHDGHNKNSISSNYVQQIFEDRHKNLWVATYYGGLNLLDRKTKTFTRITADPQQRTTLSGNNIVSMEEDKAGNIWIGTDDGGLNCFEQKSQSFLHYFNKEEKRPDLRVIFSDSKGRLWVGQTGLYLFDEKQNKFSLFTSSAGLANEFIKGIEEDEKGFLWISTSNGLTQYHPQTHQFKKYNTADGLQGLEFEANANLKTSDGELFFGGVNGFNSFYPADIQPNTYVPPVYVTEFMIFNKLILPNEEDSPLQEDISATKKIRLNYQQSTLSFSFAALNYTASENNQYAYKLEGFNNNWIYAGPERRALYTNLDPGTYTFRVKASNNDGIWNEEGTAIEIYIHPPFWDTWWFKLLVLLVIIGAAVAFYQFKRKQELKKLEEQKREEMHQVQLQFFTNISHEFRTPLSLIMGPLEKLEKEDTRSQFQHYYKVMHRNTRRLLGLIGELMDFRKAESGILKLKVMPGNFSLFLNEIAEEFSELAIQKNISFSVKADELETEAWFDRQIVEKIIINLISNSFKYTADGGTIRVEMLSSLQNFKPSFENELQIKGDQRAKKCLYLLVADNGIGISKQSIAHLFERYYKITESHMGSGIGLAFVKSLTRLHKGTISVYSELHKGTEILLALPVSKEDYTKEERWTEEVTRTVRIESLHHKYELATDREDVLAPPVKPSDAPALSRKHMLVIDDTEELRRFLTESLSPFYEISTADDGVTGLATAKDVAPDLIISDVMMPGMNGIELCKKIKDDLETSHIPFLMLTAKDAPEAALAGVESGADYYFAKPISIDLLLVTIKNIFEQRQKLKDLYIKSHHIEAKELVHSSRDKEFMDQLIGVIESQISNPDLDVNYICKQMGMSRTKLYEKIKGITGQSIAEFVRVLRLKKAVEIMTHEDATITEVIYRVGIQTQSYFTKAFKKEFGKTPTQFLQELEK
ncbi:MAG TPA: two-component regulator propeller domain-containing protein [Flavisolibacter sp.]|nr:two-component regulator propeller domain-containing protein [Flavisolibacter sp.]